MDITDALSGLQARRGRSTIDVDEMYARTGSVISSLRVSDARLQQIMEVKEENPVFRQIKVYR